MVTGAGEADSASEELLELLAWAHGRDHLSADAVRRVAVTRMGGLALAELVPVRLRGLPGPRAAIRLSVCLKKWRG